MVGECSYQFEKDNNPHGATMIYLLSESHCCRKGPLIIFWQRCFVLVCLSGQFKAGYGWGEPVAAFGPDPGEAATRIGAHQPTGAGRVACSGGPTGSGEAGRGW